MPPTVLRSQSSSDPFSTYSRQHANMSSDQHTPTSFTTCGCDRFFIRKHSWRNLSTFSSFTVSSCFIATLPPWYVARFTTPKLRS